MEGICADRYLSRQTVTNIYTKQTLKYNILLSESKRHYNRHLDIVEYVSQSPSIATQASKIAAF